MCRNQGLAESDATIIGRELAMDKDLKIQGFEGFNGPFEKVLVLPDASTQGNGVYLVISADGLAYVGHDLDEAVMEPGRNRR
jgi:hypothetical protein